jgi:hypothetical protein
VADPGECRRDEPDLAVVIATVDAGRSIVRCIEAVERACAAARAELIVVDASTDGTADVVAASWPDVSLLRLPAGTLTPLLWTAGAGRTTGRVVAFTTGHCAPAESWARALLARIDEGAMGAGGPLALAPDAGVVDRAVFYLRYSAFLAETMHDGRVEGEIAGDNAAYRREALERYSDVVSEGFWEVEFHRAVREEGGWIASSREAVAWFGPSFPLRTIVRHRYAHGRHFGASRVRRREANRWRIAAAAPFVPPLLALRAARRVLPLEAHRMRFVGALPVFMLLAGAWAFGEAVGAMETGGTVPGRGVKG